jgi:multidrug efflux pump subunit AcrA (membrane-fusion protein)
MSVIRLLSAVGAITLPSFIVDNGNSDLELRLEHKIDDIDSLRSSLEKEITLRKLEADHEVVLAQLANNTRLERIAADLDVRRKENELLFQIELDKTKNEARLTQLRTEYETEVARYRARLDAEVRDSASSRDMEHLRGQLELAQALLTQEREHVADLRLFITQIPNRLALESPQRPNG